jgi:hypothetical protein
MQFYSVSRHLKEALRLVPSILASKLCIVRLLVNEFLVAIWKSLRYNMLFRWLAIQVEADFPLVVSLPLLLP